MSNLTAVHTSSARPARARHGLVAAAAVATVAALGIGASSASAAPAPIPYVRTDVPVLLVATASSSTALRAALEGMPSASGVHVDQIMKNFVQGLMS